MSVQDDVAGINFTTFPVGGPTDEPPYLAISGSDWNTWLDGDWATTLRHRKMHGDERWLIGESYDDHDIYVLRFENNRPGKYFIFETY